MSYTPTGYPRDNDLIVARNFRQEFQAIDSAFDEYTTTEQAVAGTHWFGVDSETVASGPNQYNIVLKNSAANLNFQTGYPEGMMVWFSPKKDNTSGSGMSVNGFASNRIVNRDSRPVAPNTLQTGQLVGVVFHDGDWKIISREYDVEQPVISPFARITVDEQFLNSTDILAFSTIYANAQQWFKYDQAVFQLQTYSGIMIGVVPKFALRDVAELRTNSPTPEQKKSIAVNVFRDSPADDTGIRMWVLVEDGKIKVAYESTQFSNRRNLRLTLRTSASYASGTQNNGWSPKIVMRTQNRQGVDYRFLVLDDYINQGNPGASNKPRQYPRIISPDGKLFPPADTQAGWQPADFSGDRSFARDRFVDRQWQVYSDQFTQAGGREYTFNPYAAGGRGSVTQQMETQAINVVWRVSNLDQYRLTNSRQDLILRVSSPESVVDATRNRWNFTVRNNTPMKVIVVPEHPTTSVTVNSEDKTVETGKGFVVYPGQTRIMYPSRRPFASQGAATYFTEWYSVSGPTGLIINYNPGTVDYTQHNGSFVDQIASNATVLNWSGAERFIWHPSATAGAPNSNDVPFKWVGHPLWGQVWVTNRHPRNIQAFAGWVDAAGARGVTIEQNETKLIDFASASGPFELG